MSILIIREDDINRFTRPGVLEDIYGKIWSEGLPVALSVIPDVLTQKRYRLDRNPFVPAEYTATEKNYTVFENRSLCDFLAQKRDYGLAEICMHGYEHSYIKNRAEFVMNDRDLIDDKLEKGNRIMCECLGGELPSTFVPPFDRLSGVALKVLLEKNMHISLSNLDMIRVLPIMHKVKAAFSLKKNKAGVYVWNTGHSNVFLSSGPAVSSCPEYDKMIESILDPENERGVSVLVNHHWGFYDHQTGKKNDSYFKWKDFAEQVLENLHKISVVTFSMYAAGKYNI